MDEQTLREYWKAYVDSAFLYRIVAAEHIPRIRRHGFEPQRNPFEDKKGDFEKLFSIVLRLHKQGFLMMRWWGKPVDQKQVVTTTRTDLRKNYVDFTPASRIAYYKGLRGGALANTVHIFTQELLMKRPPLTEEEWQVVRKLNSWAAQMVAQENRVVVLRASSRYLEHAKFQYLEGPGYRRSPFGSFENFKQAVQKEGLEFYKPYLSGKKLFYLRTTKPIPASEIIRITT